MSQPILATEPFRLVSFGTVRRMSTATVSPGPVAPKNAKCPPLRIRSHAVAESRAELPWRDKDGGARCPDNHCAKENAIPPTAGVEMNDGTSNRVVT